MAGGNKKGKWEIRGEGGKGEKVREDRKRRGGKKRNIKGTLKV